MTRNIVLYCRVSTQQQGRSGLGLDAQREAMHRFAANEGIEIVGEFIEVESGANDARPELAKAMKMAKALGAYVCVSRLDRLSRDVHYISGLMMKKVPFVVADLGFSVEPLMLHIYAAFAQKERELISARTKASLQVARDVRGKKLGGYRPTSIPAVIAANKAGAQAFAESVAIAFKTVDPDGSRTLAQVAEALNNLQVKTRRGCEWTPSAVAQVRMRLSKETPASVLPIAA